MQCITETREKSTLTPAGSSDHRLDAFELYLDEIGTESLLAPDEEIRLAQRLSELREGFWRTVLSHDPLLDPVLTLVQETLHSNKELCILLKKARTAVRRRHRRSNGAKGTPAAEVERLVHELARGDTDGEAARSVLRAVDAIHRGDPPKNLRQLEFEPRSSEAWREYRNQVRCSERRWRSARDRFVRANLRLVVKIAQRYGRGRMALSDRVQEGNIGLMKAVDRFDPSRGVRFSTYAAWWIRHTVTRALVNRGRLVRIPAHLHTVFTKYRSVRRELRGGLGREPSLEEIAARIDVSLTKLTKAVDAMQAQTVEFEAPAGTIEARNTPDLSRASTPPDPGHELDLRRNLDVTQRAISKLDPLELDVIYHRFGLEGAEPLTLQRLGERHALSRERIRQLQNRALEKLKGIVEKDPTPSIAPLVA